MSLPHHDTAAGHGLASTIADDTNALVLAAEKGVIGALLITPERIDEIADRLAPSDFFRTAHGHIYSTILELRAATSPAAILAQLGPLAPAHDVTFAYLSSLTDGIPRAGNIQQDATVVKDHADARRLQATCREAVEELERYPRAVRNGLPSKLIEAATRFGGEDHATRPSPLRTDVDLIHGPDMEWLFDGIIPRDSVGVVVGEPETFKTWLAVDVAYATRTAGASVFGRVNPSASGRVIYVTNEGLAGFGVRCLGQMLSRELPFEAPVLDIWTDTVDLLSRASVMHFIATVVTPIKPMMVIFDTLAKNFTGDENSTADMSSVVNHLTLIRQSLDRGVVIVLHHMNAGGQRERGNTALRGGCDFMVFMSRTDDAATVSCSKQKDGEKFLPFTVELMPAVPGLPARVLRACDSAASDGTGPRLTEAQQRALDVLLDLGPDGATSTAWLRAYGGSKSTFYRVRTMLVRLGRVAEAGDRFRVKTR
jgi:hypothetical protein